MYTRDEAFYLAYVLFRVVKLRAGVTLCLLVYVILYLLLLTQLFQALLNTSNIHKFFNISMTL